MTAALTAASEIEDREVHPVAALFPLLDDDDIAALAEDIAARGLIHPIVLDSQGRILDGRNRYEACHHASVEPEFVTYDGDDPAGYALAVNIARRQMSKGQIAIVAARARKLNGQSARAAGYSSGVSQQMIAKADAVLPYEDLADQVRDGSLSLNEAYEEARKRKLTADSTEAKLAKLQAENPDLADRVAQGGLTLNEAIALQVKETQDRADRRRASTALLTRTIDLVSPSTLDDLERFVSDWTGEINRDDINPDRLDQTIAILTKVRGALWTSQNI